MAVNNFNRIAPVYDWLAQLVFGNQILSAQAYFLDQIQTNDYVLVLGGGSGKLLEYMSSSVRVDYVEKSKKMIKLAEKRNHNLDIKFINTDFLEFQPDKRYNVVICPFFLDCFDEENLRVIIHQCKKLLKLKGLIMVSDFEYKRADAWLVKFMHHFFRVTSNLESKSLKNIHQTILDHDFKLIEEKILHRNQLFSRLYRNL